MNNFTFLHGEGVWTGSDELNPGDKLEKVLQQGDLSVGFIGLAECLKALTGKHHGESEQAQAAASIARQWKALGKNIWAYTGWTIEELRENKDPHQLELLNYVDVLVDGPFILAERDLTLYLRGGQNQRIIEIGNERK